VDPLKDLFSKLGPNLELINIVDDSIIKEINKENKITIRVTRRICAYALAAEEAGASLILSSCSSISEIAGIVRSLVKIPYFQIDEPMVSLAVSKWSKIGVIATLKTTLNPTVKLIERKACEKNKQVEIKSSLCNGAYEALLEKKAEKHDKLVIDEIFNLSKSVDGIILAQGLMARLLPFLKGEK
jgi:aspartate/glutamate racemase